MLNNKILFLLLICLLSITVNCTSTVISQKLRNEPNEEVQSTISSSKIPYKLLKKTCIKENICYLIVYLNSKNFNKEDLLLLTKHLSEKYKNLMGLTVNFFDNLPLAQSFSSGKREVTNLFSDIRGKYMRGGEKEFLIFSPDKSRLNDSDKLITIDLKKENTD